MNDLTIIVIISVLGPVIGSLIGVLRKPSPSLMYNMLSFAAGVMLAISFLELIPESIAFSSISVCVLGIILGALLMYGMDRLLPHIHPELMEQEQGRHLQNIENTHTIFSSPLLSTFSLANNIIILEINVSYL